MARIAFKVELRWWALWYLHGLVFFCDLFHLEPDFEKLDRVIKRGLYVVRK